MFLFKNSDIINGNFFINGFFGVGGLMGSKFIGYGFISVFPAGGNDVLVCGNLSTGNKWAILNGRLVVADTCGQAHAEARF